MTLWILVGGVALGTYALKAAGPLVLGERELPRRWRRLFLLLAVSMLAALIAVQTLQSSDGLAVDARVAGLTAAMIAVAARAPFWLVVLIAAGLTAALRWIA